MATQQCGPGQSSEYDSSSGVYPDGYCVWYWYGGVWLLQSCHCKSGYVCDDPNGNYSGSYEEETQKFPCTT